MKWLFIWMIETFGLASTIIWWSAVFFIFFAPIAFSAIIWLIYHRKRGEK